MNEVADLKPNYREVVARAKREVFEENIKGAVEKLKGKLRERDRAQTVLANIDREIAELELKIEQGNL
jgi:hypothetical protein